MSYYAQHHKDHCCLKHKIDATLQLQNVLEAPTGMPRAACYWLHNHSSAFWVY